VRKTAVLMSVHVPTCFESYMTGDTTGSPMGNPTTSWKGQTFTVGAGEGHDVATLRIKGGRAGATAQPGTITVSLRAVDGSKQANRGRPRSRYIRWEQRARPNSVRPRRGPMVRRHPGNALHPSTVHPVRYRRTGTQRRLRQLLAMGLRPLRSDLRWRAVRLQYRLRSLMAAHIR